MRQTSPQRAGPSPSGALSTRGSRSWSYISRLTCSEGKRAGDDVLESECQQPLVHSNARWKCFICPPVSRSWAQCLLPYGFYFCWLTNLILNMVWLLLWDREYVLFCFCFVFSIPLWLWLVRKQERQFKHLKACKKPDYKLRGTENTLKVLKLSIEFTVTAQFNRNYTKEIFLHFYFWKLVRPDDQLLVAVSFFFYVCLVCCQRRSEQQGIHLEVCESAQPLL